MHSINKISVNNERSRQTQFATKLSPEPSFNIEINNPLNISFEYGSTFETFMAQFQRVSELLLTITDGRYVEYYNNPDQFPKNLRFEHKRKQGDTICYYFRDIKTNKTYCVFGRDAARIFYTNIDKVDPQGISEYSDHLLQASERSNRSKKRVEKRKKLSNDVEEFIIIDSGEQKKFPSHNFPVVVTVM